MKIRSVEDIKIVSEKVIGYLVQGKLTYFSLVFGEDSDISSCFFTPTSQLKEKQGMIFVDEYEKLMKVLLSHPKVSELEYDEKGNRIMAVFDSPYLPEIEEGLDEP